MIKMLSRLTGASLLLFFVVFYYPHWQHWLSYATGSYNVPGVAHNYNAFSGSLSDASELSMVGFLTGNLVVLWRAHTCHRYWWCWRHPHHELSGTPYKFCNRHHPDDLPSVAEAVSSYVENGAVR